MKYLLAISAKFVEMLLPFHLLLRDIDRKRWKIKYLVLPEINSSGKKWTLKKVFASRRFGKLGNFHCLFTYQNEMSVEISTDFLPIGKLYDAYHKEFESISVQSWAYLLYAGKISIKISFHFFPYMWNNVGNFLHTLLTEAMKNEVSINHVPLHYYASVTIINCDIWLKLYS